MSSQTGVAGAVVQVDGGGEGGNGEAAAAVFIVVVVHGVRLVLGRYSVCITVLYLKLRFLTIMNMMPAPCQIR